MTSEIDRIVGLLKKSYDQPLIFYKLHMHLRYLLQKTTINTFKDDYTKLILYTAMPNIMANQGLELKLQKLMINLKPNVIFDTQPATTETNADKIKLIFILYYLHNRPSHLINHIVLFNLCTNFMGFDDHIDNLIIGIVRKIAVASVFGLESNKKLSRDSFIKILEVINSCELSIGNRIKAIPCFISLVKPKIISYDLLGNLSNFTLYKYFENLVFYVKYAATKEFDDFSTHPDFLSGVEMTLDNEYFMADVEILNINFYKRTDDVLYTYIRQKYNKAIDKDHFIDDLLDFIHNLNK